MKKKIFMLWIVMIYILEISGCKIETKEKVPVPNEKEEAERKEKEEKVDEKETEELIKKNTDILLSYLDISKYGAEGCSQTLQQIGCHELVKVEITDTEECYSLTLTDENDQEYYITLGYDGYLGIIKDGEGNYLYAPVD